MNTDDGSDPLSSLAHSVFFLFPKEFCSRLGERDRDLEQDLRHSSVGVQRTPGGGIWTAQFRSLNSALSLKLSAFMMMDVCNVMYSSLVRVRNCCLVVPFVEM